MIQKHKEENQEANQLGDTLRLFRTKAGMTQEQLAEAVGVSPGAIGHYEDNTWRPGTSILARLAEILGVTFPELINGCSILYDENGKMLLVRHIGHNQIKVIGSVTEQSIQTKGC